MAHNHSSLIRIKGWGFRPRKLATLVVVVGVPIFCKLGFWQLDRAAYKAELAATLQQRLSLAPSPLTAGMQIDANRDRFLPLQVTAQYLNAHTILLDNQILNKRPGVRVLTPVKLQHQREWLLVDRGWLPWGTSRTAPPSVAAVTGSQLLQGRVGRIVNAVKLPGAERIDVTSKLVQRLDFAALSQYYGHALLPWVLQLQPQQAGAYEAFPQTLGVSRDKHLGYALQWFVIAATLLLYYITVNTHREQGRMPHEENTRPATATGDSVQAP